MAKVTHLTEKTIQELEAQGEALASTLATAKPGEVVTLVQGLLRSYRMAANVANAAWRMHDENAKEGCSAETFLNLERALECYAPGHFTLFEVDREMLCRQLELLYDDLVHRALNREEVLEEIYTHIFGLQHRLR
jgi:hypothetical protein